MLQMVQAFVIVMGIVYMQKRRKQVLSMDADALIVDDDEYWKSGWYMNPNDPHLWIQDRMCSTNYTMNMAKPMAKVITVGTAVFLTIMMVGVFSLLISLENAKISVLMDGNQVTIDAAMYDTNFKESEIQSVRILEKMPEDDFIRTNGGATEKYLIGYFEGKETGKCMMYLYRDYTPILEIRLTDKIIYVNSRKQEEVQEWYRTLIE